MPSDKRPILHATVFDMSMVFALSPHFPEMTPQNILRLALELGLVRLLDTYVNPPPKRPVGRPPKVKKPKVKLDAAPKMIGDDDEPA